MMRRHIDAETLARFRQGDLSPRQNARIRAHLAGCERCRDLNEDLAGVTTMLASAQPPPIPEHLTAHTEGLCAVVWHLLVFHPSLSREPAKWESISGKAAR